MHVRHCTCTYAERRSKQLLGTEATLCTVCALPPSPKLLLAQRTRWLGDALDRTGRIRVPKFTPWTSTLPQQRQRTGSILATHLVLAYRGRMGT